MVARRRPQRSTTDLELLGVDQAEARGSDVPRRLASRCLLPSSLRLGPAGPPAHKDQPVPCGLSLDFQRNSANLGLSAPKKQMFRWPPGINDGQREKGETECQRRKSV
jgi:hypothetical protein